MIFKFDKQTFKINELISDTVFQNIKKKITKSEFQLERLHEYIAPEEKPKLLNEVYSLFRNRDFQESYDALCTEFIEKFNNVTTRYQSIPSIRIQLPGDISVDFHADMFYGHGENIINYWMPITKVFGSNSMHIISEKDSKSLIESAKGTKQSIEDLNKKCIRLSKPLSLDYGEVYKFHSTILHGTLPNKTDRTRVSIDFRMVEGSNSTGLKDDSFFIEKRGSSQTKGKQIQKRAMLYFNREGKEDLLPSQKYQQLSILEFCDENSLVPVRLETELSGFDYFPALFHVIGCAQKENFNDLVIYSKHNLPTSKVDMKNFEKLCNKNQITVHFVLEDTCEKY